MSTTEPPTSASPVTHEIGRRTYVVADVDPLDADGVRTIAVGTTLWLIGFIGLLPFYGRLRTDGHLWWLWTCLAGFGLGLAGWDYSRRRRRERLERSAAAQHETPEPTTYPGRIDLPADPPIAPAAPQAPESARPPAGLKRPTPPSPAPTSRPARPAPPATQKPPFTRRPGT